MMVKPAFSLAEIARRIKAELKGDGERVITGISPLQSADASSISFLHNSRYRHYLASTRAAAVIVSAGDAKYCQVDALIAENPYLAFAKSAALFAYQPEYPAGIHPTAVVGPGSQIDPTASVGPYCVLGKNVVLQKGVILEVGCMVGDNVSIGENSHLWPHVSIYHGVQLKERVGVHSGVVIGSDGFGLARENNKWYKVPQIGSVIIESDVEIGANTTIDRGTLGDTVIGEGAKLDNQIQIAHNVQIGSHTAIAGCVGISGSTQVGNYCMIGGGACIAGHLTIADKVVIAGMAMITNSIHEPGVYASGTSFQKQHDWQKSVVRFRQLDKLAKRVKALEEVHNLS